MAALDTNGDGILSADEIAAASNSLKKLDKNGDGQLTPDEYLPERREGDRNGGGPQGQPGNGPQGPGNNGGGKPGGKGK
jgi:hypothetical protein